MGCACGHASPLMFPRTAPHFPTHRSRCSHAAVSAIILAAIFFILAENKKYDGDILFILVENNSVDCVVGTPTLRRDDGRGDGKGKMMRSMVAMSVIVVESI